MKIVQFIRIFKWGQASVGWHVVLKSTFFFGEPCFFHSGVVKDYIFFEYDVASMGVIDFRRFGGS
jgi:hypothetical protein